MWLKTGGFGNSLDAFRWHLAPLRDCTRRDLQVDCQFRQAASFGLNPVCELVHPSYVAPLKL